MDKEEIILKTIEYVKAKLSKETTGHDWWHVYRVWKNGKYIAGIEKADSFVVELTSLLHDIADWKFNNGDENIGSKISREWLESLNVDKKVIDKVCDIIARSSFKGGAGVKNLDTLEGKIVQDADRLDAIGAIGIARAFATGAKLGEIMYSKDVEIPKYFSVEEYKQVKEKGGRTVINHFYEKLLLLKDLMNTETAKKMAGEKHKFMELFLNRFLTEWEG
jgi:uncharacterized protein